MHRSISVPCILYLVGIWASPEPLWAQGSSVSRRAKVLTLPVASVAPKAAPPAAVLLAKTGPASLAAGTWTGTLPIAGSPVAVSVAITRQGKLYGGIFDIPGGTLRQRQLQVTQRGDTLHMREFTLNVQFTCTVSADGQLLSGHCVWPLIGSPMPLAFHRGTAPERNSAPAGRSGHSVYDTKWENGTLENEQPVGLWNYYRKDEAGAYVLIRSYDHTARRLTFARPENEALDAEVRPGVWERVMLTQMPWFIGRHDALTNLGSQLTYPAEARERHVEGKVWVTFAVDTLGRVSDHRILRGLGSGCDEEALRIARTIPDTWTPALLGNKAVACRKTLMFAFKLRGA